MEFLHPTDFPLTVVTDASHADVDGAEGAGVEEIVAGAISVTAFTSLGGNIS